MFCLVSPGLFCPWVWIPLRDYAELTVNRIAWYTGRIAVVLGVLGLAWLVARAMQNADPRRWLFVLLFLITATRY